MHFSSERIVVNGFVYGLQTDSLMTFLKKRSGVIHLAIFMKENAIYVF